MPKKRSNRPRVDDLLPGVDDDLRATPPSSGPDSTSDADTAESSEGPQDGKATSRQNDKPEAKEDGMSAKRQDDVATHRQDDMSAMAKQLAVLMDGPGAPFADALPELRARANGYLSEEVETALQQATSVLKNHHGKSISKSMLMDYAIRLVLWDLRENAEESRLVRWLQDVQKDAGT